MDNKYILTVVAISAIITFSLRAFPFVVFRGEKQLPEKIKQLGNMLPPAIMAVLVIYCLKDINGSFKETGVFQLIAVAVVAVTYKLKHNTLLSCSRHNLLHAFITNIS